VVFGAPVTAAIVPVPFPSPEEEWTHRPEAAEIRLTVAGIVAAVTPPGGLTEVQRAVMNAHLVSMTEHPVEVGGVTPIGPEAFAESLRYRSRAFRERMVQIMLLAEMLLVPIPREVSERVELYAAWLGVGDDMIRVVRRIATGSLGLALIDFQRNGYFQAMLDEPPAHLHTSRALEEAWESACSDDELHARWAALEHCPEGSLGLGVWRFYRARGFTFPGRPESAPPHLAQHDWIHVLADYGSTVESEIEVFALISRANDDPGAFALLAMVLGLFETGYLYGAAKGFFEYDRGHLSGDVDRMAVRLADATYRGAMLATHLNDSGRGPKATDLLATDWFAHADRQLDDVRAEYGLPPRSSAAIAAGSTTPWERGGISPFQYAHGRDLAHAEEREYDSFGAEPG
jgi:hypothetical protein